MKKLLLVIWAFTGTLAFSQQVESLTTILHDKISIRALELYDHKIWYSGTDSKFGFVDLNDSHHQKQIQLSDKKLQFRTLAQDKNSFYAINIESPAYFFKIDKKSLQHQIIFTDSVKTAFYDALHFINDDFAYALSDADKDNDLKLAVFNAKGRNEWYVIKNILKLNEGEAAFAASNTNIASTKNYMWVATGGKSSRIFKMKTSGEDWDIFNTPVIQGESSQGIYSIDFLNDQFGIAVGGDYTRQDANINNIATTKDGGETWQIQASGKNAGYTTCVKIKPKSKGKEIIAVGDQHISYSSDFGKSWKKISGEKGFFVCKWVDSNTVILAGKDKISVLKLKF